MLDFFELLLFDLLLRVLLLLFDLLLRVLLLLFDLLLSPSARLRVFVVVPRDRLLRGFLLLVVVWLGGRELLELGLIVVVRVLGRVRVELEELFFSRYELPPLLLLRVPCEGTVVAFL